jgi:hypothetical protein
VGREREKEGDYIKANGGGQQKAEKCYRIVKQLTRGLRHYLGILRFPTDHLVALESL